MMSATNKAKKPRRVDTTEAKPCCGTLNYIAECRGLKKKPGLLKRQSHSGGFTLTNCP